MHAYQRSERQNLASVWSILSIWASPPTRTSQNVRFIYAAAVYLKRLKSTPIIKLVAELREFWLVLAFGTYQTIRTIFVPDVDASFVYVPLPVAQSDPAKQPANGLLLFTVQNNTSQAIENVEIVAHGIRRVDEVKVQSSSGRLEAAISSSPELFQLHADGSMSLTGISQLVPRASITLAVEGVFFPTLFTRRVHVSSDTDFIQVSERKVVGGLIRMLNDYAVLIGLVVASIALVYDLRRYYRQ